MKKFSLFMQIQLWSLSKRQVTLRLAISQCPFCISFLVQQSGVKRRWTRFESRKGNHAKKIFIAKFNLVMGREAEGMVSFPTRLVKKKPPPYAHMHKTFSPVWIAFNRIVIMAFLVWSLFFVPVRRYSSAATQKETPELENTLWRYCNLNYI